MECWPSYRHLADRTSQDIKTVEAGIKRLRDEQYILDTGVRQGRTGGVVVYRLNTTKNGLALSKPEPRFVAPNDPISGGALPSKQAPVEPPSDPVFPASDPVFPASDPKFPAPVEPPSDPVFPASDPKFPDKRPQISVEATPKTGYGISNGISNGIRKKESGRSAGAPPTSIPGVADELVSDWLKVRKEKRVGPITNTVVKGVLREAEKVGLTLEQAVRFCCEAGWAGFNSGWYLNRTGKAGNTGRPDDRTARQLQTAGLMTGALFTRPPHQETFDVQSRLIPS